MDYYAQANADWFDQHARQCLVYEAKRQDVPVPLAYAVMKTEGGKPGLAMKNTNGTYDLGPMQINTVNIDWIARTAYGRNDAEVLRLTEHKIKHDPCSNISAGIWILKTRILESNGDVWRGVGRYHSPGNRDLQHKYAWRVFKNLIK